MNRVATAAQQWFLRWRPSLKALAELYRAEKAAHASVVEYGSGAPANGAGTFATGVTGWAAAVFRGPRTALTTCRSWIAIHSLWALGLTEFLIRSTQVQTGAMADSRYVAQQIAQAHARRWLPGLFAQLAGGVNGGGAAAAVNAPVIILAAAAPGHAPPVIAAPAAQPLPLALAAPAPGAAMDAAVQNHVDGIPDVPAADLRPPQHYEKMVRPVTGAEMLVCTCSVLITALSYFMTKGAAS
jgi:hypothetical protein